LAPDPLAIGNLIRWPLAPDPLAICGERPHIFLDTFFYCLLVSKTSNVADATKGATKT